MSDLDDSSGRREGEARLGPPDPAYPSWAMPPGAGGPAWPPPPPPPPAGPPQQVDWGWGPYGPWNQLPWYAPPPPPPPPRRSNAASIVAIVLVAAVVGLALSVGGTRLFLGSGGSTTTSAIAGRVDPEVVDIDSVLAGGAGEAAGTGMVMTSNGYVLTNNHVIAGSSDTTVQIDGTGTVYSAKVIGDDPANDVAVVKIEGVSGLKTANFGDSDTVTIGDRIYVVGNALGKGGTPAITTGIIADLNQTITASDPTGVSETLSGLIQIQAKIQSGDSGGPLVNSSGQIVGMDTAGQVGEATGQDTSEIGFAIPIDDALTIARQIEAGHATGTIQLGAGPLIGIDLSVSTSGSTNSDGAVVEEVEAGTPAATIGLTAGDVITSLGGTTITSASDLTQAMRSHRAGQTVSIGWVDVYGTAHTAQITLASGPPA